MRSRIGWMVRLVGVGAAVWLLAGRDRGARARPRIRPRRRRAPVAGSIEDIVYERYARGEIDRETFERALIEIGRGPGG